MKKLILSAMLLALSAVIFAQSSRIRSEDSNVPEIDNLSGLKPDGEDLESDYVVTGLSDNSAQNGSTGIGNEENPAKSIGKGEINTETIRSIANTEVYPNPATDFITISTEMEIGTIRILNLLGQEMSNYTFTGKTTALDISELKEGIYFISVESGSEKIVKKIKVLY